MRNIRVVRFIIALALVLFVLANHPYQAQAQEPVNLENYPELLAKAQAEGTVRVIIGLDIGRSFVPEGYLSSEGVRQQRQAIKSAQKNRSLVLRIAIDYSIKNGQFFR